MYGKFGWLGHINKTRDVIKVSMLIKSGIIIYRNRGGKLLFSSFKVNYLIIKKRG